MHNIWAFHTRVSEVYPARVYSVRITALFKPKNLHELCYFIQ